MTSHTRVYPLWSSVNHLQWLVGLGGEGERRRIGEEGVGDGRGGKGERGKRGEEEEGEGRAGEGRKGKRRKV